MIETLVNLNNNLLLKGLFNGGTIKQVEDLIYYDYNLDVINKDLTIGSLAYPGIVFMKSKNDSLDMFLAKTTFNTIKDMQDFVKEDKLLID